jgi:hypothetical protein
MKAIVCAGSSFVVNPATYVKDLSVPPEAEWAFDFS